MVSFARCRLDVAGRLLLRDGHVEPLEPQAFDVLVHLISNRERVVPKEEILDAVWGDRWVSESALTTRIKEIRRAVGDTGNAQETIRTVRGRGYQFVAPADDRPIVGTSLVGRSRDVETLSARLVPGSLVTLVGPGGVGKTTLGRSLASALHERFRYGCLSIDLTVVRDHEELAAVIGRAAQLAQVSAANLPDLLRDLDALLVLDDADELLSDVAALCTRLRTAEARITVLVTCRQRLGVPDEHIWPVLPLADDDGVELLTLRARELAPLGSLATAESDQVRSLAKSVDQLPLALEMLASASAYLGRGELSELVSAHPEQLTDPRRDAPARHRTLEVLLTDSLDRLDTASNRALIAVSTFAGPFRLMDAVALLEDAPDALGVVRSLVDRSLLSPSISGAEGIKFQMLRTVTRAVHRSAPPAALNEWRGRHASWVALELQRADTQLRSAEERVASRCIDELADDARVAHAWARANDIALALRMTDALHLYAHSRLWAEPADWAQAIDGWRDLGPAAAAAASQASQDGRFEVARDLGRLALDDPNPRVRGWALEALSDVAIYQGELIDAEQLSGRLSMLGVETGDSRQVALGTTNFALACVYGGRPLEALRLLEDYPGDGLRSEAPTDRAWLEYCAGEALSRVGQTKEALDHLRRSYLLGVQADSRFVAGIAQSSLAGLQLGSGDVGAAAQTYRSLLSTFRRHGILTHLTIGLRNVVQLLATVGADEAAATLLGWVLSARSRPGYGPDVDALMRTREAISSAHGAATVNAWEDEGAGLTPSEAVDLALQVLERVDAR